MGVLLATCVVHLNIGGTIQTQVRALIDPGSEISLVTTRLAEQYRLPKLRASLSISGVGGSSSGQVSHSVSLALQSRYSKFLLTFSAFSLGRITNPLPSFSSQQRHWAHLQGLQLADPGYLESSEVDVLLGADVYGQIVESGIVKAGLRDPIAQRTKFGWAVLGPTEPLDSPAVATSHVVVAQDELRELLVKFWEQEEVASSQPTDLTVEEAECEQHFLQTHSRDASGRYVVRLPLCLSPHFLGTSYPVAHACLGRLLRKLSRDELYRNLYTDFLREYEDLGHMVRVSRSASGPSDRGGGTTLAHDGVASGGSRVPSARSLAQANGSTTSYFLPHHGVLRPESSTTKLRVVFNGSSKTSSGKSLNDISHSGAKLQRDISDVLLWSRQHRYIFMTDITKMFRQIRVHEGDWSLQQILWIDANGDEAAYHLSTVTYGTRSAPFLAVRVLHQLVEDEGGRFPLAIAPLRFGRYVDDICGGADSPEELNVVAEQVAGLCAAGGFPLAKWQSNSSEFLREFSGTSGSPDLRAYEESEAKILGLSWRPFADTFVFSASAPSDAVVTKRTILSEIAQLFDPLGFLAPVVTRAKLLLQGLWLDKLGWDDAVSPCTAQNWNQFREELALLSHISVPRWLGLSHGTSVEIHGFSDASQLAMAAVVYLKVVDRDNNSRVTFVCSKTKVAPLKKLTIPRLELSAALLLARLVKYVREQIDLTDIPIFLWTDSSVTLAWISSHPSRWKEFVRNRVQLVQELMPVGQWKLVSGKDNPADCASRGLSSAQLIRHRQWWHGPTWLNQPSLGWPSLSVGPHAEAQLEEKPGILLVAQHTSPLLWELISRYSSLSKLLRVTAICQRFISRLRKVPNSSLHNPLNPGDLELARCYWLKATQEAYFSTELKALSHGSRLSPSHPFTRLTAFIDHSGVLRVGGRLKHAHIPPESKNPAILPRNSPLTELVIRQAHQRTLHGGTQLTLAAIRQSLWIIGGRAPVRSFILKCVACARQRGVRAQQLMGQLPPARVTPARPFLNSGVDYAGPVSLRSWKGRGHKAYKGWLVIFVCMATSAVHLEVVSDYTADGFIAAYRRMTSRRGICKRLYSDCGTNFLGAEQQLKKLFATANTGAGQLATLLLNEGTQWSFNPPGAPHFGGKWEAAVKSVKFHLNRAIGETLLTFEELTTLLTQVEAVLNSRPLEPLSEDPDDLSCLTPGHFLMGTAPSTIPEPSLEDLKVSGLSRWQLIQQKLQSFWKHWSRGYLQQLQSISKWHHAANQILVGSMVLLSDERFPPSRWPLARVVATHPGADGLTRVVTIRTATSTLKRPIAKLVLLPVPVAPDNP